MKNTVITIGNFDGVHLGHQALIKKVVQEARRLHSTSILVTFDPHPRDVLSPETKIPKLFDLEDQKEQARNLGIEQIVIEKFTREYSKIPPEKFIGDMVKRLNVKKLIIGHDFAFGANRSGNFATLETLGDQLNFEVEIVPPFEVDGTIVSSSLIRRELQAGHVEQVQTYLGRPFYIKGNVVHGAHRGKTLGFPTANVQSSSMCWPINGVYAGIVTVKNPVKNQKLPAVTNIGTNPTFEESSSNRKMEIHILDYKNEIYGEEVKFEFLHFLRLEQKFSGIEALKIQIESDVKKTKDLLSTSSK